MKILLLLAFLLQEKPPEPARISRGPYLQAVTPRSALVVLQTSSATDLRLHLEKEGTTILELDSSNREKHLFELRDLTPSVLYRYRITIGDHETTASFRTFPETGEDFTFVAYGDGRSNPRVHQQVTRAIAGESPLFVLHSGDLVENGKDDGQWDLFFSSARDMLRTTPLYPALGNHDRGAANYFDLFHLPENERFYSFDVGPMQILVLDSNVFLHKPEEQLAWCRKTLNASRPYRVVVYHHPAFSTSLVQERIAESTEVARVWAPLFQEFKVSLVIQGHNHNYQRAERGGVTYVTTGGGGAPLYPLGTPLPETRCQKIAHHYVRFRLQRDAIHGEAVDLKGEVFDRFTLPPQK